MRTRNCERAYWTESSYWGLHALQRTQLVPCIYRYQIYTPCLGVTLSRLENIVGIKEGEQLEQFSNSLQLSGV